MISELYLLKFLLKSFGEYGNIVQVFYWSTGKEANTARLTETIHAGFGTLHLMEEVVELR